MSRRTDVLGRLLDDTYAPVVRRRVGLLTAARLTANSAYRFAPPFLATIARDTDNSLATLGVALTVSELGGFLAPLLGRVVDHLPRRRTMVGALAVVSIAAFAVAASSSMPQFAVALLCVALAKTVFDLALGAWISDHTDYAGRGRVVGLTELSWAGGLLIGVPAMGLVTALTSWRGAYVLAGVAVLAFAGLVAALLDPSPAPHRAVTATTGEATRRRSTRLNLGPKGIATVAANGFLMAGAQCAFVTFGPWLEDVHRLSSAQLAGITVAIGFGELIASSGTVALTDRLGKRRAVMAGALLMVPTGLALATFATSSLGLGVALLVVYIVGFEFAVVSSLSLASNLVPGRPSTGIGLVFGAGTAGRAVTNIVATRVYESNGIESALALGTVFATTCVVLTFAGRSAAGGRG